MDILCIVSLILGGLLVGGLLLVVYSYCALSSKISQAEEKYSGYER